MFTFQDQGPLFNSRSGGVGTIFYLGIFFGQRNLLIAIFKITVLFFNGRRQLLITIFTFFTNTLTYKDQNHFLLSIRIFRSDFYFLSFSTDPQIFSWSLLKLSPATSNFRRAHFLSIKIRHIFTRDQDHSLSSPKSDTLSKNITTPF